ncbi:hypothetical protein TNCV_4307861 [Trichonephila clavipes]|nr:hypothetical protein TNCV_4307861 [Trichonephila clavipes]
MNSQIFNTPGSGNGGKENRFEQTSRTLQRKISCVQPKINLLKRRSYACEKQCFPVEPSGCPKVPSHDGETILLCGLDEKGKRKTYRCGQRTVRLAVVAAKAKPSRAGAAK